MLSRVILLSFELPSPPQTWPDPHEYYPHRPTSVAKMGLLGLTGYGAGQCATNNVVRPLSFPEALSSDGQLSRPRNMSSKGVPMGGGPPTFPHRCSLSPTLMPYCREFQQFLILYCHNLFAYLRHSGLANSSPYWHGGEEGPQHLSTIVSMGSTNCDENSTPISFIGPMLLCSFQNLLTRVRTTQPLAHSPKPGSGLGYATQIRTLHPIESFLLQISLSAPCIYGGLNQTMIHFQN